MNVVIINRQRSLKISRPQIIALTKLVIEGEGAQYDEVTLHFINNATMCQLHEEHFGDPSPTDCISFPLDAPDDPSPRSLGDVFICPATALAYTAKNGGNPSKELALYVIHGLLHLLGYDDIDPTDRRQMRKAEQRYIKTQTQVKKT